MTPYPYKYNMTEQAYLKLSFLSYFKMAIMSKHFILFAGVKNPITEPASLP